MSNINTLHMRYTFSAFVEVQGVLLSLINIAIRPVSMYNNYCGIVSSHCIRGGKVVEDSVVAFLTKYRYKAMLTIRIVALIIFILLAYLFHLLIVGVASFANWIFLVRMGEFYFQIVISLLAMLSYSVPISFFAYCSTHIDAFIKREMRYFVSKLPFLKDSNHNTSAELVTLKNESEKRIASSKSNKIEYNKLGSILCYITDSIFIVIIFLLFPIMFYIGFQILRLNTGFLPILTFIHWIILFTTSHRIHSKKRLLSVNPQKGLNVSLFIIFCSSLVILNVDISTLVAWYEPFDSYVKNENVQNFLLTILHSSAELAMQWSIVQGLIFAYLDRKGLQRKTNKDISDYNLETIKDTESFLGIAILKDRLNNTEGNGGKNDLVKYMFYLYDNPEYRESIMSLDKNCTIIPWCSFPLEDNDIEEALAFIEKICISLDDTSDSISEDDSDIYVSFARDSVFHKRAVTYLEIYKKRLRICANRSCSILFTSEKDDICSLCKDTMAKNIIR